jgi:hypothetical protein
MLVVDDDVGGHLECVDEVGPGDKSGEIENWIRKAVGGEFGEAAEEKSEYEHIEDGLENNADDADGGLLVADFNVAPDEKVEELAVGPNFAEAKLYEAVGRLDSNGGGDTRGEWQSGARLRDGSHARSNEIS